MRIPGAAGAVSHAEIEFADGLVLMGCPGPDYRNPRNLGGVTQSLYVYVDDVDEHYAHARAEGAKILQEPSDQFYGDRPARRIRRATTGTSPPMAATSRPRT